MKIIVNGLTFSTRATTLSGLLEELDKAGSVVATAVNEEFVPVSGRVGFELSEGDRVEVVAPQQGG